MINFDLKNRVAVVTGGAQGFGLAITERFIASGASVVIWDIDEEAIKTAINKINSDRAELYTGVLSIILIIIPMALHLFYPERADD